MSPWGIVINVVRCAANTILFVYTLFKASDKTKNYLADEEIPEYARNFFDWFESQDPIVNLLKLRKKVNLEE